MSRVKSFIWLCLIGYSSILFASDKQQLGLWYTGSNPDYKPFQTEHGVAVSYDYFNDASLMFKFKHNDTDFLGSGPEVGGVSFTSWTELGAGYQLNSILNGLYVYASYTSVQSDQGDFNGPGIHVGYNVQLTQNIDARIQVGQIDTNFFDVQLEGQLNYQFSDSFAVSFALRDHHDWDHTSYQVGALYRF